MISVLAPRTFSVAMYVVERDAYDPVFNNTPSPMWETCPVWIRPGTTIYQVQAIDSLQYGAIVQYRLESGKVYLERTCLDIQNVCCYCSSDFAGVKLVLLTKY